MRERLLLDIETMARNLVDDFEDRVSQEHAFGEDYLASADGLAGFDINQLTLSQRLRELRLALVQLDLVRDREVTP